MLHELLAFSKSGPYGSLYIFNGHYVLHTSHSYNIYSPHLRLYSHGNFRYSLRSCRRRNHGSYCLFYRHAALRARRLLSGLYDLRVSRRIYIRNVTWKRLLLPEALITVFVHLGLNTLWLTLFYGKAASAILTGRIVKNLICFPLEIFLILLIYKAVYSILKRESL